MKSKKLLIASDILFYARSMRHVSTKAEMLLWVQLRNRKLNGYKFRRQYAKGRFILDFYCSEANLAIELDGSVHDQPETQRKDAIRQAILLENGVRMIRFRNDEVKYDLETVLKTILHHLDMFENPSPH